jgi:predicted nuclease with TOPRIM domain
MTINIEQDLANILNKLDQKLDKIDNKFDEKLNKLDNKIDEKLEKLESKIEQRFDKVDERLNKLEIGQADLKGEIKALDTKTEQLDKRIGNVEFANRGILVGLVVVILGGFAMFFWMASKL